MSMPNEEPRASNKNRDDNNEEKTPPTTDSIPLDWTQLNKEEEACPAARIRLPADVTQIDPSETDLIVIGTAGEKITRMGVDLHSYCNPNLKRLILRSHIIRKMEGLGGFQGLELLELYDNSIEAIEGLDSGEDGKKPGVTLRVLDISYNVIRDMAPVQLCPNLVELYIAQNKLKTLSGLKHLSKLRKLDLGANRIRVMDENELSGLVNLEELWLGKNKIEKIQGIDKLTKLKRLDVQSNRLTTVQNLTTQVDTLEELYLASNAITNGGASQPTGLALPFSRLTTLDLSKNRLTTTKPFQHLCTLEDLWLSGNSIATFNDIQPISILGTREGACLEGIYLEFNPIANEFEYRKKLAEMIPSLEQIDANRIQGDSFGGGTGVMRSVEDRMREMQNLALIRARLQQQQRQQQQQQSKKDKQEVDEKS